MCYSSICPITSVIASSTQSASFSTIAKNGSGTIRWLDSCNKLELSTFHGLLLDRMLPLVYFGQKKPSWDFPFFLLAERPAPVHGLIVDLCFRAALHKNVDSAAYILGRLGECVEPDPFKLICDGACRGTDKRTGINRVVTHVVIWPDMEENWVNALFKARKEAVLHTVTDRKERMVISKRMADRFKSELENFNGQSSLYSDVSTRV